MGETVFVRGFRDAYYLRAVDFRAIIDSPAYRIAYRAGHLEAVHDYSQGKFPALSEPGQVTTQCPDSENRS